MNGKLWFCQKNVCLRLVFLCFMLLAPGTLFVGCGSSAVTISIAGKEFKLNKKLQDCIDIGLITTNVSGEKQELTKKMDARTASFESYRLGNDKYPRKCPVLVMCYNPSSSKKSIYECLIMTFIYNLDFDSADQVQVLINDIDFWGMTEDEALKTLEEEGFDVDYDQMHEKHFNVFKKGKVTWTIESDRGGSFNSESKDPLKKVVDFDDNIYYISQVKLDISGTLNLKSK